MEWASCVIFKPVHEAELDLAGKNIVNPLSAILCAKLMMEWLEIFPVAKIIDTAVQTVLSETDLRTPDLGGKISTPEMTRAIIEVIEKN